MRLVTHPAALAACAAALVALASAAQAQSAGRDPAGRDPAAAAPLKLAQATNPTGTGTGAPQTTPGTGGLVGTPSAPAEIIERPVKPGSAAPPLSRSASGPMTSQEPLSRSRSRPGDRNREATDARRLGERASGAAAASAPAVSR